MDKNRIAKELLAVAKELTAWGKVPSLGRDFYAPKDVKPIYPEGTNLEIYSWETPEGLIRAMAFEGKQSKPLFNYRFRSESERERHIEKAITSNKRSIQRKEERKRERQEYRHDLQKGDILVASWGYDQTNINFYQIIDVTEKSVKIREVAKKTVKSDPPADYVVPIPGKFTGSPKTKRVSPSGSVKVSSSQYAFKWDGKPEYETSWGWGH